MKYWLFCLAVTVFLHGFTEESEQNFEFSFDELNITYPYDVSDEDKQFIMLSSPRSGSTWLMYILNYLTDRDVIYRKTNFEETMFASKRLQGDIRKCILRYHDPEHLLEDYRQNLMKNTHLICIVRNYKEVLARRFMLKPQKAFSFSDYACKHRFIFDQYMTILHMFDYWMGDQKYMIYYEALMRNPKEEILKLSEVLGINQKVVEEFLENLDFHTANCLKIYDDTTGEVTELGGSKSKGKELFFHSKKFPNDELCTFDRYLENAFPRIFRKYLSRYKTLKN